VLWIICDDHAAYVTGCYGNERVKTPNIDALASAGMRFDRAYCNSPVCTASRQSFLTGRYPRSIGVSLLPTPLPESELTLADVMKEAGYETAAFGKMHFNSQLKHGFDLRIDLPEYQQWIKQKGREPLAAGVEVLGQWKPFRDPANVWLNSGYRPFGATLEDMPSTFIARRAREFLTQKRDKPFFALVSFYEPHSPYRFPVEFTGRKKPADFDVPKVGPEDDWQIPAIFRDLTDDEKRGIQASYYTSVEYADWCVGQVLEALEKSGQADNTLVIYVGDHGYCLGHHGRFEKHCMYEQAIRAPLIVSNPKNVSAGSSTEALVEFVDIGPTILDVCGIKKPERFQGRSLVPLLEGKADKHREYVMIEYGHNDEACIRTDKWKLVYERGRDTRDDGYDPAGDPPGPKLRLFDLTNDPDEMTNVVQRPENRAVVSDLTDKLVKHLVATTRRPERIPRSFDPLVLLDFLVQPDDVAP
jgi:choline-sulfatase